MGEVQHPGATARSLLSVAQQATAGPRDVTSIRLHGRRVLSVGQQSTEVTAVRRGRTSLVVRGTTPSPEARAQPQAGAQPPAARRRRNQRVGVGIFSWSPAWIVIGSLIQGFI